MTTSIVNADSLLALDIGEVNTRAALFDIVDGRYRFLASGMAPTTINAPFHDASEGIRAALDQLQAITGRRLVGADERLIVPESVDGAGVDTLAVTLSAGPPLKAVVVGLLEDVSMESACRLASTTYTQIVERISLNDRRKPEARLDTILRARPDLILAVGGTEGGASNSVLKLLESVGLASFLLPPENRPELLYAGNVELQGEVKRSLERITALHFAPNVRPALEVEQLEPAQVSLADLFRRIRSRQMPGVQALDELAHGGLASTAQGFGRIIRFLSKIYTNTKGVLGVDVGASATSLAAAFEGELTLGVYPQFGLGSGLAEWLESMPLSEITRWLPADVPDDVARDYLYTKAAYPASIPTTIEDLYFEEALARQAIAAAVRRTIGSFPSRVLRYGANLLPWFEPVVASGSVLTHAPSHAHSLMMLLDGLQPTGVTTVVLDQYHLSGSLGAAAATNPVLAVQVLESSTFLNLGTVVTPITNARPGTPVLRVRITAEDGAETSVDVKSGALEMLPLPVGQPARLHLQPLHRADVGMGGPGRGGGLRVVGGALGVVVDARGRPLKLPSDAGRRHELLKKWLWTLGG